MSRKDTMSKLFPGAYEELINEDIAWLETNTEPPSLERGHIIGVLRQSVREYRVRGYGEAMSRTGPHYSPQLPTESTERTP